MILYEKNLDEWNKVVKKAEANDATAICKLGIAFYQGKFVECNKLKAFDLISQAMQMGLKREESNDDYPGYDHGELVATWFLAKMLLDDEDGILSKQTEPFWFEKITFESASDVEQLLMYITGGGCVARDLRKAWEIAFWIESGLSFSHRHISSAEDLCYLLKEAILE